MIVKDLSRFGREYIDSGKYIERLFPALGVRFIAVNDHIDSKEERSSPNEEEVYVLSGLVVCADCGAPMIKRNVPAGGKFYSYYICSKNAATRECGTHRIPKDKLERLVFDVLHAHIADVLDILNFAIWSRVKMWSPCKIPYTLDFCIFNLNVLNF